MLVQGVTLLGVVTTSEATGMDKDAARNSTDLALGLARKTSAWLWQGSSGQRPNVDQMSSLGTQSPPLSSLVTVDNKGDGHQG